jgi:ribose transport system permease protein
MKPIEAARMPLGGGGAGGDLGAARRRIVDETIAIGARYGVLLGLLVALIVANYLAQPSLFSVEQIGLTLQTALPMMLIAVAETLAVLLGELDLSVGGIAVVANVLCATWLGGYGGGDSWHFVLIIAIVILAGAINGCLIAVAKFESFIATLATWSVFNGVALTILSQDGGEVPTWITNIVTGRVGELPNAYLIVAGTALALWWIRGSRYGRRLYAVGSDAERARLNGVRVRTIVIATFALGGLCAGLGGIMLAGATSTGQPTAGDAYILPAFAALVIGGTRLTGGSGGAGLTILGVLVLTLISNFVQAVNLEAWVTVASSSALLLLVVATRAVIEFRKERI